MHPLYNKRNTKNIANVMSTIPRRGRKMFFSFTSFDFGSQAGGGALSSTIVLPEVLLTRKQFLDKVRKDVLDMGDPEVLKEFNAVEAKVVRKICSYVSKKNNGQSATADALRELRDHYLRGVLDADHTRIPRALVKRQLGLAKSPQLWKGLMFLLPGDGDEQVSDLEAKREGNKLVLSDLVTLLYLFNTSNTIEEICFALFTDSEYMSKKNLNRLISVVLLINLDEPGLFETFLDKFPNAKKSFFNFMKIERSEELFFFYQTVKELPDQLPKSQAQMIYRQFIEPESAKEINISGPSKENIKRIMETSTNAFLEKEEVFGAALEEVIMLMSLGQFPRYVRALLHNSTVSLFEAEHSLFDFKDWLEDLKEAVDLFDPLLRLQQLARRM